jgi:hypothetical protein
MAKQTQIGIGLDQRPGTLARLCAALHRAGVNVQAISATGDLESCWVRIIANPVGLAKTTLTEEGYHFTTQRVLALRVTNEPGQLERIAGRLSREHININYIYGSNAEGPGTLIMSVSELDRAAAVLRDFSAG